MSKITAVGFTDRKDTKCIGKQQAAMLRPVKISTIFNE